jgi:leucyl-tRNA synthetase
MDPHNANALVDSTKERHWAGKSGVDMYVGGAEHATRHLIYARFWHKVLFDMGVVSTPEPFEQLISVGLILAEDGRKMSKRFGNVINPEDIIETWGADTMRLYTMFMGPFTDAIAWNTENMIGARRFLERLFRLGGKVTSTTPTATEIELHKTIKKVTSDIQDFKFNTAIAQMMILLNTAEKEGIALAEYRTLVQLVAPFAPHIAEELWHEYGGAGSSVHTSSWPTHDESKLISDTLTIAVQVLGKLRTTITIARTSTEEEVKGAAREAVRKWTEGKSIAKEIYVPGKIVNFIVA